MDMFQNSSHHHPCFLPNVGDQQIWANKNMQKFHRDTFSHYIHCFMQMRYTITNLNGKRYLQRET